MSTYAIGDIQGCHQALIKLLEKIQFNVTKDCLWFVGDIVNRGPHSLQTLQFIMDLGEVATTVLGNHELYLLAIAEGVVQAHKKDTLTPILSSPEKDNFITWIRQRPLMHYDATLGFCMVHAGLHPSWPISQALTLANEVSQVLNGDDYRAFIKAMFGDQPAYWHTELNGNDRWRFIVNCLTRMRYLSNKHELNFNDKRPPGHQASHLIPWFAVPERQSKNDKIIFGHWSTLHMGDITDFKIYNIYPIDTGYIWGRKLTALRLEDEKLFIITAN